MRSDRSAGRVTFGRYDLAQADRELKLLKIEGGEDLARSRVLAELSARDRTEALHRALRRVPTDLVEDVRAVFARAATLAAAPPDLAAATDGNHRRPRPRSRRRARPERSANDVDDAPPSEVGGPLRSASLRAGVTETHNAGDAGDAADLSVRSIAEVIHADAEFLDYLAEAAVRLFFDESDRSTERE